jgi:hypothetical protein
MPSRFVRETDYMLVVMPDYVDLAGVKALVEEFVAHPQFESGMPVLWDARPLSRLDLNFDDMRDFGKFVAGLRPIRGGGRSAMVANDDAVFGTFRVHQLLNQSLVSYEFHVFRDFDEARRWLLES